MALGAFSNLGDPLTWGWDRLTVKRLDELPSSQRRILARISIDKSPRGATIRLVMYDKLSALDKLCKLFGLYALALAEESARPEIALSDVERAQRLTAILRRGDGGGAVVGGFAGRCRLASQPLVGRARDGGEAQSRYSFPAISPYYLSHAFLHYTVWHQ